MSHIYDQIRERAFQGMCLNTQKQLPICKYIQALEIAMTFFMVDPTPLIVLFCMPGNG